MAGVSIGDFGASFIHYQPGVVKVLNNTSLARLLPKGKIKWEGSDIRKTVHVSRNTAIGAVGDGGTIPAAGKQGYVPMILYRNFLVGAVQISDGLLNNATTTEHAAITVVESELRGMTDGIRKWENFHFTRDGTGVVATMGATVSGATFTVSDARQLWDKAHFEIRDATTTSTIHDKFQVSSVARALSSGEMTVTPDATLSSSGQATGDLVCWLGSSAANASSYNNVPMGLDGMIDNNTGTFQGINNTTYPRVTSPVLNANGVERTLTPSLFRQALGAIKQESGDDPPDGITGLTNHWGAINVEEMYEGSLRITESTKVAGIEVASFQSTLGKVNIVDDCDSPYGKLFLADFGEISRLVQKELDWRRQKGGGIFRPSDNSLTWVANCLEICEFAIERRNRCAKIEDIRETIATAYG